MRRGERKAGACYSDDVTRELCLTLFVNMAEGVIFQDDTGKVIAVNPAAESILGFSQGEMVGRQPCWRSFSEEGNEYPTWETPSFVALEAKNPVKAKLIGVYNPKDDANRWLTMNAIPVKIGEDFVGVLTTFEDTTSSVNVRLGLIEALRREKECSRAFQKALLPRSVSIGPGYRVAHVYLPQDENIEVGGDLYDVFSTPSGLTGVMIGDAAGKGLEPASVAAVGCNTARAFTFATSSPGKALTQTNAVLCSMQPEGNNFESFVTMLLVVLDQATGRISYSSAGHLPPMIRRRNGKIDVLVNVQQPLGIFAGINYKENMDQLFPGDKIVLYTDGVTEARKDPMIMFEQEGLLSFLKEDGGLPPDQLLNNLLAVLSKWTDNRRYDDTAIVIIERAEG